MRKILYLFITIIFLSLTSCGKQNFKIINMEEVDGVYQTTIDYDVSYINLNNYVESSSKFDVIYNNEVYSSKYELVFNLSDGDNEFIIKGNNNEIKINFFKNHLVNLDIKDKNGNILYKTDVITNVILDFDHVKQNINVPAGYDWDGSIKISLGGSNLYIDGLFQDINIVADTSMIPIFTPKEYEVNVSDELGSTESYVSKVKTGEEITFEIEGLPGYEFKGVYAKDELIEEGDVYHPDMGTEFVIKYEPINYHITYLYDDKEEVVDILYGNKIPEFTPTKKGHSFNGWRLNNQEFNDDVYKHLEDITLTGEFIPSKYVIYYTNILEETHQEITFEEDFELLIPTKEGSKFLGWYLDGNLFENGKYLFDKDITLVAKWEDSKINLNLEDFGGSVSSEAVINSNGSVLLPTPIKENYSFVDWYYDVKYQEKVDELFATEYNNEMLYAKYVHNDDNYIDSFVIEKYNEHISTYDVLTMFNGDSSGFASKYWHKIGIKCVDDKYYVSGIVKNGESLSTLGEYDYIILGYTAYQLYSSFEDANITVGTLVEFSEDLNNISKGNVKILVTFIQRDVSEYYDEVKGYLDSLYNSYHTIEENIELVENYNSIDILWKSSHNEVISSGGIYHAPVSDISVTLSAYIADTLIYEFIVVAKGSGKSTALATGYIYTPYNTITQNAMNVLDIIYCAFLDIDENANFTNESKMTSNINNYIKPLAIKSGTKIVISVNQGPSGAFSAVSTSAELREKLATNIVNFIEKVGIDGIDIDWETPASSEATNFTLLMKTIYEKVKAKNPNYLVTAAIGGGKWQPPKYDLPNSKDYLDYVNLMTYSMATGNGYYQNALFKSTKGATLTSCTIEESIELYNGYGIKNNKILVGIPFYLTVQTGCEGPGSKVGSGKSIWYNQLDTTYALSDTMKEYFDEECGVPYRFDSVNKIFISYENERSIKRKCEYINTMGLAGIMYWQYGQDVNDMLSNAIGKYINA